MNQISNSGNLLLVTHKAGKEIAEFFGIGRMNYAPNRVEQGGWLVGYYHRKEPERDTVQAVVTHFFPAVNAIGSATYLEWPAMENIRLQRQFFNLKDDLVKMDPDTAEKLALLGWIHSHPCGLPVFLSSTDMENIMDHFNDPAQFSVVLNPHREIWKAFLGPAATEVPSLLLPEEAPKKAVCDKVRHKGLKPSRHYGRPKKPRKKRKG